MTKKQLNVDVNQLISGQLPPEENCPPVRVGVLVKARVIFRVGGGNETSVPEENCLLVRVRVWVRASFGAGGQFSSGAIFLEPNQSFLFWNNFTV